MNHQKGGDWKGNGIYAISIVVLVIDDQHIIVI
jgi:hypothetical protein